MELKVSEDRTVKATVDRPNEPHPKVRLAVEHSNSFQAALLDKAEALALAKALETLAKQL